MAGNRVYIAHRWRLHWVMVGLVCLELPLTVGCLVLYGVADPDTYRTKLWQNGFDQGFNSAPNEILYAYANYKPIHVPLVWSSFMTQFNIVISVLSMFVLLTKTVMYLLHGFLPIISVFVHAILLALYSVALHNQSAADMSDPDHPSPGLPWYLSKGCSYATKGNYGYCMMARATFAITCVMIALFFAYLCVAIHSCFATKAEIAERTADHDLEIELKTSVFDPDEAMSREEKWARNRRLFADLPKTPTTGISGANLMTPRTTAFTQLSSGAGEPSAVGRRNPGAPATNLQSGVGASRPLAFREQYSDDGGNATST